MSYTAAALLAITCNIAGATEGGAVSLAPGDMGQESTLPPQPGFYAQLIDYRYRADQIKDANGRAVSFSTAVPLPDGSLLPVSGNLQSKIDVHVVVPYLVYVADTRMWGARPGVYVALPLMNANADVSFAPAPFPPSVPAPLQAAVSQQVSSQFAAAGGSASGVGDLEVGPFLSWRRDNLSVFAALSAVFPTGAYNKNRPVNPGLNYYTLRPTLAAGVVTESGFDVAGRFTYSFNSRNRETDYKSGQYLGLDYMATYEFIEHFKIGMNGYYINQVTDDSAPAGVPIVNGNRIRVSGIGPMLAYLSGDEKYAAEFKYLKEHSARARPEGSAVFIKLTYRF